jgi:cytochrome c oxidase subunit IV
MESGVSHTPRYWKVFAALIILLVVTVGVSFLHLGPLTIPIAMFIAIIKAWLVLTYFMHLGDEDPLHWVFAMAGVLWLAFAALLTFSDYLTR